MYYFNKTIKCPRPAIADLPECKKLQPLTSYFQDYLEIKFLERL